MLKNRNFKHIARLIINKIRSERLFFEYYPELIRSCLKSVRKKWEMLERGDQCFWDELGNTFAHLLRFYPRALNLKAILLHCGFTGSSFSDTSLESLRFIWKSLLLLYCVHTWSYVVLSAKRQKTLTNKCNATEKNGAVTEEILIGSFCPNALYCLLSNSLAASVADNAALSPDKISFLAKLRNMFTPGGNNAHRDNPQGSYISTPKLGQIVPSDLVLEDAKFGQLTRVPSKSGSPLTGDGKPRVPLLAALPKSQNRSMSALTPRVLDDYSSLATARTKDDNRACPVNMADSRKKYVAGESLVLPAVNDAVEMALTSSAISFSGACLQVNISGFTKLLSVNYLEGIDGLDQINRTANKFLCDCIEVIYQHGGDGKV